jgi:heme/copper-type cytochrome/quinol oxidase subunit 2
MQIFGIRGYYAPVLALTVTQAHPYALQWLMFWLALIPIALLVALVTATSVWRKYRRTRHGEHPETMRRLLRK